MRPVSLPLSLALALASTPLTAGESPSDPLSTKTDCDTLRAIHQRLTDDDAAEEARKQLARAILLLPDCSRSEGRLQQARTLDGVELFRADTVRGLFEEREREQ